MGCLIKKIHYLLLWLLMSIAVILLLFIMISCAVIETKEVVSPQPTFYSPNEPSIMFIPKGTRIGDIVAPEDGIFIGESKILDMRIIEVPAKEKQDKINT